MKTKFYLAAVLVSSACATTGSGDDNDLGDDNDPGGPADSGNDTGSDTGSGSGSGSGNGSDTCSAPPCTPADAVEVPVTAACSDAHLTITSPTIFQPTTFLPFNEQVCHESASYVQIPGAYQAYTRQGYVRIWHQPDGSMRATFTFSGMAGGSGYMPELYNLLSAQGADITVAPGTTAAHRDMAPEAFQHYPIPTYSSNNGVTSAWLETKSTATWQNGQLVLVHAGSYYTLRQPGTPCPRDGWRRQCSITIQ
jgi:hypothetical protein